MGGLGCRELVWGIERMGLANWNNSLDSQVSVGVEGSGNLGELGVKMVGGSLD